MDPDRPALFLSVQTDSGQEDNEDEAMVVGRLVAEFFVRGLKGSEKTNDDKGLAVVCAHRVQNNLVRKEVTAAVEKLPARFRKSSKLALKDLVCDTVERIQGQEREVIIVSLTGSDPDHLALDWTFSHCPRRFNVSITRPRTKLIVIGSPSFFHFTPPTSTANGSSTPADDKRLAGVAKLKRWYLDRLTNNDVIEVPVDNLQEKSGRRT